MKNQIETLDEAIENGLNVNAVYAPNGEVVSLINKEDFICGQKPLVMFQDGSEDTVDRNDLIDFTWE